MVKTATAAADVFSVVSATGAAADADSLPTGTLYVDGVANGATVTVTNIAGTGLYSWSVTMPALTAGQIVAVVIALTVGGVASHGIVYRAQADTNWQSETHTRIGTNGAGLSAVPWNAAWDAEVQSEAADALTAYGASTYAGGAVASVTGAVGSVAAGGITAASIATDAAQEIADVILRRTAANIEASANGDTLSVESLYGVIMASFEAALSGTTLTVRKSDGTTLGTKTVTVDAAADPITGIT